MSSCKAADAVIYGIDLGKSRFDVVGSDVSGALVGRYKFTRKTILSFFETASPALIGMEAWL